MIAPERIDAVVQLKSRNARKKIRLMLFVRFGPKASAHAMPVPHAAAVKSLLPGEIGIPGWAQL